MKRKILIIAIVALVLGGVFYIVKKMLTAENLYTFNISKTDGLKSILLSKGTVQKNYRFARNRRYYLCVGRRRENY